MPRSKLQPLARKLRNNGTIAEATLWKYALKVSQRRGYGFKRQRPILSYIADFVCLELLLIIEVDGMTHEWKETVEKDSIRQQELEEAGFTVLRFTDDEVMQALNNVVYAIDRKIRELESTR